MSVNECVIERESRGRTRDFVIVRDMDVCLSTHNRPLPCCPRTVHQKDNLLGEIFRSEKNSDIYKVMASKLFKKPLLQVSKEDRSKAKTLSLGIIYGMGKASLAAQLSSYSSSRVSAETADDLIKEFLSRFPLIRSYTNRVRATILRKGFIETISMRRRLLPDLRSPNSQKRAYAERQSLNSVIQGSASDMVKLAMVAIREEIERQGISHTRARIVMQIHDEIGI